jgi:hypothetical protein
LWRAESRLHGKWTRSEGLEDLELSTENGTNQTRPGMRGARPRRMTGIKKTLQ